MVLIRICWFLLLDTWRKDVKCSDIEDAINSAAPEKLKVISVSEVAVDSLKTLGKKRKKKMEKEKERKGRSNMRTMSCIC